MNKFYYFLSILEYNRLKLKLKLKFIQTIYLTKIVKDYRLLCIKNNLERDVSVKIIDY